jgi:RES domain-containing protein
MSDAEHFAALLTSAPARKLCATFVRRVQLIPMIESAPVDFLFTSGKPNRFNPAGISCIYFAEDEATAAAEFARHFVAKREPVVTYFAQVQLRTVLDLCDVRALTALDLNPADLRIPWVGARRPTATQNLGEAISRQKRISAIRFPSFAAQAQGFAGANVVIYRGCVHHPDFVHILGPTRRPLQKWPQ